MIGKLRPKHVVRNLPAVNVVLLILINKQYGMQVIMPVKYKIR